MAGRYQVILADPPWHWAARSARGEGRSARNHYDTMTTTELGYLRPMIDCWAAKDCALFVWVLNSMRQEALDLIDVRGFKFKTVAFTWAKTNANGSFFTGMGYWSRQNTEQCLLATRGRPQRLAKNVP